MQELPAAAGIDVANWNWKVVRQFASERFSIVLSRSSCLNWLHRLGFAFKRPRKSLVNPGEVKRESPVAEYADLREEARRTGGKIFFADEVRFRSDAELRGKWTLKGEPALVESTRPRRGERASYYSAVCLKTGEVEWMELERGTATPGHPRPSWPSCAGGTRTAERDLGQRAGAPGGGDAGVPANLLAGAAACEPAGLQPGPQCR